MKHEIISLEEASTMSLDEYINKTDVVSIYRKKTRKQKSQHSRSDQCNDDDAIPNSSSVQWRLMQPYRPIGMPPVIPKNAPLKKFYNGNNSKQHRRGNWSDDSPHILQINRNNLPNFKTQNRQNYSMLKDVVRNATVEDVLMGTNAISSGISTNLVVPFNQPQILTTVGSLLNQASYMDMAKVLMAEMAKIKENQRHESKYNMSVQMEIAEIQQKPLHFNCGSQKIVSFDGPGVDCNVRVNTTDISMNQRFS